MTPISFISGTLLVAEKMGHTNDNSEKGVLPLFVFFPSAYTMILFYFLCYFPLLCHQGVSNHLLRRPFLFAHLFYPTCPATVPATRYHASMVTYVDAPACQTATNISKCLLSDVRNTEVSVLLTYA